MAGKRGAKGSGMIRQRSDGRWEARYTVGRDPGTGKQIQKSIYGKTQNEVRRKLNGIIKDIDDGQYSDDGSMTVGRWMDIWLEEYTLNIKDTTKRSYSDQIRLHIKPGLGAVKLSKLTPLMIQRFYNKLSESGRIVREDRKQQEDPGLSARSVRNVHNVLHKALKQATRPPHSLIKYNPADAVELPRVVEKEMNTLTKEEIAALLNDLKNDWHYPMFYVAMFCGLRRGELLGLQWKNIDFEKRTIRITGQLQRERKKGGINRIVPLKNDKTRVIYPADSVFDVLLDHKHIQDIIKKDAGDKWQDTGAVFTNPTGGWLEGSAVYRCLMRHLANIGIEDVRLHDLRHTFATISIAEGVDIKTLQEELGHHDPGFTLRVYGHTQETMKREAAAKIQSVAAEIQNNTKSDEK